VPEKPTNLDTIFRKPYYSFGHNTKNLTTATENLITAWTQYREPC